jgi:hypothetical protein
VGAGGPRQSPDVTERSSMQTIRGRSRSCGSDHSAILMQQRFCVSHDRMRRGRGARMMDRKGQEQWLIVVTMITR